MIQLSIVAPVYNESAGLKDFYEEVKTVLKKLDCSHEIILVDDGSQDDSFTQIRALASKDPAVRGISLSRNFGHQAALTAGLEIAQGKAVVTLDSDLQHPPQLIPDMYQKFKEGYDIVTTVRLDDPTLSAFKRLSSRYFYRFINYLSDTVIQPGAADFRLMNQKSVEAFKKFHERVRFTRGLVNWMGFSQITLNYQPKQRHKGESKYTFRKMLLLAFDGLTAFSSQPLRISFYLGLLLSLGALCYAVYTFLIFLSGIAVQGWSSVLMSVLLLGGIQLISVGIVGEYLARVFNEVKHRPIYFIREDTSQSPSS